MSTALRPHAPTALLARLLTGEERITAASLFEARGVSRLSLAVIGVIGAGLCGGLGWAALMPVAEITVSSGEVMPAGSVQHVQHLEGGILARLLVAEGDVVEEGQPLLELSAGLAEPELAQLRSRLAALTLRSAQLAAALQDRDELPGGAAEEYRALAESEAAILRARRLSHARQREVLERQIEMRRAEMATLESQSASMQHQIGYLREQVTGRADLVSRGLSPRFQLLEYQRELARMEGAQNGLRQDALRLAEALGEAQSRLAELESRYRAELISELGKVTADTAELRQAIQRVEDRVGRLRVTAPVRGTVQGLQTQTIGGVIAPGTTILDIVPSEGALRVEARISTRDIGYIRPGQPVAVKVLTYDYTRFGSIAGTVSRVSPSSFRDAQGTPFYKAEIALESDHVGQRPEARISSGMTVLADIRTGERSLLNYLLAPIYRSLDEAFRER